MTVVLEQAFDVASLEESFKKLEAQRAAHVEEISNCDEAVANLFERLQELMSQGDAADDEEEETPRRVSRGRPHQGRKNLLTHLREMFNEVTGPLEVAVIGRNLIAAGYKPPRDARGSMDFINHIMDNGLHVLEDRKEIVRRGSAYLKAK